MSSLQTLRQLQRHMRAGLTPLVSRSCAVNCRRPTLATAAQTGRRPGNNSYHSCDVPACVRPNRVGHIVRATALPEEDYVPMQVDPDQDPDQDQVTSMLGPEAGGEELAEFLQWLVANGVKGIGSPDSKLALYQGEDGDRGLVAIKSIAPGDVLLEIPLRLALTDFPEDEESNELLFEGAPWSVRLACKLLRQLAAGQGSPWWPYLRVLPRAVPTPLEVFTWEDIVSMAYPPGQAELDAAGWMVSEGYRQASDAARGGCGEGAFRWAMSLVHSRTFGSAAKEGGVGVRMLVPLVDMFNHSGDMALQELAGQFVPTENARWDLVPADQSDSGGWCMRVSATEEADEGEPLLLSYGERPNDDFMLHYGFVPRGNPHDEAVLFGNLTEALDWHWEHVGARTLAEKDGEPLYRAALALGEERQAELLTKPGVTPEIERQLRKLKVVAGSQVSEALIVAFAAVSSSGAGGSSSGTDEAAKSQAQVEAERAVALRAAQMLVCSMHSKGANLLQDLAVLAADADPRVTQPDYEAEPGTDADYYLSRLQQYNAELLPGYAPLLGLPAAPTEPVSKSPAAGTLKKGKFGGMPPPAAAAAAAAAAPAAAAPHELVLRFLPPAAAAAAAVAAGSDSEEGGMLMRLAGPARLALSYRTYKQMVLWDLLLASGLSAGEVAASGVLHERQQADSDEDAAAELLMAP